MSPSPAGTGADRERPFGAVLLAGGLLVLLVPRTVDDRPSTPRTATEDLPSPR